MLPGIGTIPIARGAGPERVFVELQPFGRHAAEDHRAQASVADGKSVAPEVGGLVVPEDERAGRLRSRAAYACRSGDAGDELAAGRDALAFLSMIASSGRAVEWK